MKQIFKLSIIFLLFFSFKTSTAVEKGDFKIYVTTNLGHHSFIPSPARSMKFYGYKGFIGGVTLNMDYAASQYFSIGGWFTFSGRKFNTTVIGADPLVYKYRSFGMGMRGVFHLYQLISEKGNTKLDANKFDLYIPLAIGGGFRLRDRNYEKGTYEGSFGGGAIIGSGIGISYYFVEHIGANLEAGYLEGSYSKIGLVFKF